MMNSDAKARSWLEFLAGEPFVPFGPTLQAHFNAGTITRLCGCGCNSFDLEISQGVTLEPIVPPGRSGKCFRRSTSPVPEPKWPFWFSWTHVATSRASM